MNTLRKLKSLWSVLTTGIQDYRIPAVEVKALWVDGALCTNNLGHSRGYCVCAVDPGVADHWRDDPHWQRPLFSKPFTRRKIRIRRWQNSKSTMCWYNGKNIKPGLKIIWNPVISARSVLFMLCRENLSHRKIWFLWCLYPPGSVQQNSIDILP